MLTLKLREWERKSNVDLTAQQIGNLQSIDGIRVEARTDGKFDITPTGNLVGYVRRGDTSVVIEPSKCGAAQVIFMMGYSEDPNMFGSEQVDFDQDEDLLEAFISVFVRSTSTSIRRGLFRTYASQDEDLSTIRGRIRMSDQMARRFRLSPPIAVTFDEFTVDNYENRILRGAIQLASQLPIRNQVTARGLQYLRAMFSDVSLVEFNRSSIVEPVWNRLNEHLRYPVSLARRILTNSSISLDHGIASSDEFLVNMANVFEDFVATAVREHLNLSKVEMPRANELKGKLFLDEESKIRLKPDLSRWQGERCIAIGDVKYKRTTANGVNYPDIYQLLAYATAANLPQASVIYAMAKDDEEGIRLLGDHLVLGANVLIKVFALDLQQPSSDLLLQISEFADNFREHPALAI
jgi:5-methylcytosine-specific restriction enzyme subunit McrC